MDYDVFDIELSKETEKKFGFTVCSEDDTYVRVKNVDPRGTAWEAGIKEDDHILMINGTEIRNTKDVRGSKAMSTEKLNIKVKRFTNLASNHSASVNELNTLGSRRFSAVINPPQRDSIDSNVRLKQGINASQLHAPRKMSLDVRRPIMPNFPDEKLSKPSDIPIDVPNLKSGSSVPVQKNVPNLLKSSSSAKDFPQQKPTFRNIDIVSEKDISIAIAINKSESSLLERNPSPYRKKSSAVMSHCESSNSLFDSSTPDSSVVDYVIDWRAIYGKISAKIGSPVETELVSYFRNSNVELTKFPLNCLYRFITLDDVLKVLFCDILNLDGGANFEHVLQQIDSKISVSNYELRDYDIARIIRCNISNSSAMIRSYQERKISLNNNLGELKLGLHSFLKKPDDQNKGKLSSEIDNVSTKILILIDFLMDLATSMAMWKSSIDLSHLFPSENAKPSSFKMWFDNFIDFKSSEQKISQQFVNLFKMFREECHSEVFKLFDKIFSENIEVSICVSILKEKNDKDIKIEQVLRTFPVIVTHQEQFV